MFKIIVLTTINLIVLVSVFQLLGLRFNVSDSYPLGLYRVTQGEIRKNDLVQSCLPEKAASLMIERDYVHTVGACKGYPPVLKKVAAVAGDRVDIGENISINGNPIPNTTILNVDEQGKRLVSASSTTIEDGHVWLLSTYTDISYDSRYYGSVPVGLVKSRIEPLWVMLQ